MKIRFTFFVLCSKYTFLGSPLVRSWMLLFHIQLDICCLCSQFLGVIVLYLGDVGRRKDYTLLDHGSYICETAE